MVGQQTNSLGELCRAAAAAVRNRGHVLDDWVAPHGHQASARMAVCRHCGRTVSVRSEPGLTGVAGPALTEHCRAAASERTTG
jgi:hypothetical protein